MYKQVKRVSLTFALFVFFSLQSVTLFAPPAPSYPGQQSDPLNGVPIDNSIWILALLGIITMVLLVPKFSEKQAL